MRKWPISKSISSTDMQVIKRLTEDYDTPRQYVHFNTTDVYTRPRSASVMTFKLEFNLWQTNFVKVMRRNLAQYSSYLMTDARQHDLDPDPRSRSRSQKSESCESWPISKCLSSTGMHVIKTTCLVYSKTKNQVKSPGIILT